jgi:hypothetical protein
MSFQILEFRKKKKKTHGINTPRKMKKKHITLKRQKDEKDLKIIQRNTSQKILPQVQLTHLYVV